MFCISLGEVTFLLKLVNGKHMYSYMLKPTTPMNQGKHYELVEENIIISSYVSMSSTRKY